MKRILIVAVYYPPSLAIGAKRPHKIAKYLSEDNWEVTVLTVDPALTPPIDHAEFNNEGIQVIRTKAFVPYVSLRNKISCRQVRNVKNTTDTNRSGTKNRSVGGNLRKFRNYLVRKTLTSLDQIDEWSGWKKSAIKVMKKSGRQFDVVMSTIPPNSTAYLGMQLAAHYQCKFVLDYRDPWCEMVRSRFSSKEYSATRIQREIKIENECLEASDLILAVSPAISAMLRKRVDNKILTIPQGFTGEIDESRFDREQMYLLYAGSLAYGRNISNLLSALHRVGETYDEHLKLVYCGPDSELAWEQADSLGATQYIDIKGSVSEIEVTEYAKRSLCNFVIISPGYEYSYPGKLFDLVPAGRPIYVTSQAESQAGTLVENLGIGYSIPMEDIGGLVEKLKNEINRNFKMPGEANDLRVDNIYRRMVDEGLNEL